MIAEDIKNEYADGGSKPYFKFYKNGQFLDEIKYISSWSTQEPKLKEALERHNGAGGSPSLFAYSTKGKVYELKNLEEFNSAMFGARNSIIAVCFHNGCPEPEAKWDEMKSQYTKIHFYKVNTIKAEDIRDKYADKDSKPYFKFYKNGAFYDEVKYSSDWGSQEKKVRSYLQKHNGYG